MHLTVVLPLAERIVVRCLMNINSRFYNKLKSGPENSLSDSCPKALPSQVAVMDEAGEAVGEVHVENSNFDDRVQRYAGTQITIKATTNYYHIRDTLSEHSDVAVAHKKELNQTADTDKQTDRVDISL